MDPTGNCPWGAGACKGGARRAGWIPGDVGEGCSGLGGGGRPSDVCGEQLRLGGGCPGMWVWDIWVPRAGGQMPRDVGGGMLEAVGGRLRVGGQGLWVGAPRSGGQGGGCGGGL